MSETTKLPNREDLPEKLTWDLTPIFSSDQEFDKKYEELTEELKNSEHYKGTLGNGATAFLEALEFVLTMYRKVELIYVYSHLKNDQDTTNTTYQALYARAGSLLSKVSEAIAWYEPEVLQLSDEQIWQYFEEEPKLEVYRHYVKQMVDNRAHILSADQEALLAGAGEIFGASSGTFAVLNNADLEFPTITGENGEKIQLSHGVYGQLLESTNREVREAAFKGLYSVYAQFRNTFASTLGTHIKGHNFKAKARRYASAREAALSNNHIPESVYDTLVTVVNKHLPLLHRYMELRKRLLNVDTLHMYDLYTPVLGEAPIKFTYEEAVEKAIESLAPMGEEYLAVVKEAFSNRWIDVVENKGKRSGAYSSGSYDTNPYILMNWHDTLDQLFTLVHEMGHSVHSYFTRSNQPFVYGDYSIFLAEIASTTNENILTEHLLATEEDPRVRAYVLNHYLDGFKGTIFRQTQFAEFEHFMHQEDAKGTPLTSEYLSESYGELNAKYYGPAVEKDPEIKDEWARIPHFYYNYYVYQYSTGFSAASALAKKIWEKEPGALDAYLTYLKAGNSDYPVEVMKKAGVDMTQAAYIEDAMAVFEQRLNELEALVEEL
ncbi:MULTISPECIES: oligoendopeptidase F [Enterococcus]|uniref:Oligopeptidase F n=1 Tax=Enterococcus mundtii TaxID=53346 RepID=A0A2M9FSJ9_ENTMU|nr:oligoendopeptidase F [Enterococcus mundtii]MBE6173900.1 oligoendopeptidase F [Enterococcus faecium]EOH65717.1 oligoendopeptidase F [Enterococcus mundtii ATCC 882]EOU13765.1 oligoendopeptidase F [Enterococcus mundtii ATCC 882]MBE9910201.1 oligoendopeptidase F [Enterococcus mundtii]PJK26440.1 oligoendopeptidase F [Enterococcus mundtii]